LSVKELLTETQLAQLAGFNDNEVKMLTMFWNPIFNQSWIYLSDEMILKYLTNETKKDAITDFYRRILIPTYQEGIDYKEVSIENELVKSCSANLPNKNSKVKPAHNKKYYIVSGEAYKCMLMASKSNKGKETRYYYIKVETLARCMKDYLFEMYKKQSQKQLDESNKEKNRLLKLHNQMSQKHKYYKFKNKGPVFYIITSGLEYKDNIIRVKIGIAGCSSTKIKNCPNCNHNLCNKEESESLFTTSTT
jgi:hypothetical protein